MVCHINQCFLITYNPDLIKNYCDCYTRKQKLCMKLKYLSKLPNMCKNLMNIGGRLKVFDVVKLLFQFLTY